MSAAPEVRVVNDGQELADEAADLLVWLGTRAIAGQGSFRIALAGGATPKGLYAALVGPRFSKQLNWTKVEFFFGDERCVPPDHPESNFRMAHETLFRPLGIEPGRIFRMESETANREEAARRYEATLRKQFGVSPPAWPRFDVVLLGLGEDAHTASLFPDTPVLNEHTRLVVTNEAPKGIPHRLTLTAAAINRAWAVMFLVVGSAKAEAVRAVLERPPTPGQKPEQTDLKFPARLIQPMDGRLIWFLDRDAASRLAISRQGIVSHEE